MASRSAGGKQQRASTVRSQLGYLVQHARRDERNVTRRDLAVEQATNWLRKPVRHEGMSEALRYELVNYTEPHVSDTIEDHLAMCGRPTMSGMRA
jgi:hypothetical protein